MSSAKNGPAMTADHVEAARLSARHHADEAAEAEWTLNNFLLKREDRAAEEALAAIGALRMAVAIERDLWDGIAPADVPLMTVAALVADFRIGGAA